MRRPRRPTRRTLLVVTIAAVLAATGTGVTIGFRTGWLTTTNTQRPVGRLRPADLTTNVAPPIDLDTTAPSTPLQPTTTRPTDPGHVATSPAAPVMQSVPSTDAPTTGHNDHDADD